MSDYIVSARKYRPDSFESLIGQDTIARTLKNSIQRGKLGHAYLFCGPRGVGKTSAARIFAKTINCSNPVLTWSRVESASPAAHLLKAARIASMSLMPLPIMGWRISRI